MLLAMVVPELRPVLVNIRGAGRAVSFAIEKVLIVCIDRGLFPSSEEIPQPHLWCCACKYISPKMYSNMRKLNWLFHYYNCPAGVQTATQAKTMDVADRFYRHFTRVTQTTGYTRESVEHCLRYAFADQDDDYFSLNHDSPYPLSTIYRETVVIGPNTITVVRRYKELRDDADDLDFQMSIKFSHRRRSVLEMVYKRFEDGNLITSTYTGIRVVHHTEGTTDMQVQVGGIEATLIRYINEIMSREPEMRGDVVLRDDSLVFVLINRRNTVGIASSFARAQDLAQEYLCDVGCDSVYVVECPADVLKFTILSPEFYNTPGGLVAHVVTRAT